MRTATAHRQTTETDVQATLDLDGTGQHQVETGIGFLDHMLAHVAVHGLFDLAVRASGDLHVDPHHTVEDVALTLGQAFDQASAASARPPCRWTRRWPSSPSISPAAPTA